MKKTFLGRFAHSRDLLKTFLGHFAHSRNLLKTFLGHFAHSRDLLKSFLGRFAHSRDPLKTFLGRFAHSRWYLSKCGGESCYWNFGRKNSLFLELCGAWALIRRYFHYFCFANFRAICPS